MAKLTVTLLNKHRAWTICRLLFFYISVVAFCGFKNAPAYAIDHAEVARLEIEAAYLFKFGSYVDWPDSAFPNPASPLTIAVIDADIVADALVQMAVGRTINDRPVIVRKLRREDSLAGVNVLFIGRSGNAKLGDILAAAKGRPILTVTESAEGLAQGSMLNFVLVESKVRFEAAPKVAIQGNLSISARLLAAAYKVAGGP